MIFLLLNTYGANLLVQKLKKDKVDQMMREAKLIDSEYMSSFFDETMSLNHLTIQLKSINTFLGIRVWIVNSGGNIITDSSDTIIPRVRYQ
jgi:hypothetical protein